MESNLEMQMREGVYMHSFLGRDAAKFGEVKTAFDRFDDFNKKQHNANFSNDVRALNQILISKVCHLSIIMNTFDDFHSHSFHLPNIRQ
jgi:hypothetical protein